MNSVDRANTEKNRAKEIARKEPYELIRMDKGVCRRGGEKIEKFMCKILEVIDEEKMSYLEVNEAMYQMDTLLRERSLEVPIVFKQKGSDIE